MVEFLFLHLINQQLVDLSDEQLDQINSWLHQEAHVHRLDMECQKIFKHYQEDEAYDIGRAFYVLSRRLVSNSAG